MLYQQIAANKRRTVVVMIGFSGLVLLIGGATGYLLQRNQTGIMMGVGLAIILAAIYIPLMVSHATSVVMFMNRATKVEKVTEQPQLWHIVEDMAMVALVPMPAIYIIKDKSPNALATGRDPEHAAIGVTTGLLKKMDREELEGVVAHEMSHIKNYDIRLQSIALALTAVIMVLAEIANRMWLFGSSSNDDDDDDNNSVAGQIVIAVIAIVLIVLAPLLASLLQMALSRNREYLADASGVQLTRNPQGLIRALTALKAAKPMKHVDDASAALYINDPKGKHAGWFDTHPSLDDRIARLQQM